MRSSNLPIGAVVLVLIFFLFHPPKGSLDGAFNSMTLSQKLLKLDPLGSIFIMSAVVCILLALQWGVESNDWDSATVIGLLVAFPILLGLFVLTQWMQGLDATLPLWLFKQRSMLAGGLFSFFFSMPTYVVRLYVPDEAIPEVADQATVRILSSHILPSREGIDGD